ncbi:MAG: class IV adenylate cyclase [Thermoplasmata archaeon]
MENSIEIEIKAKVESIKEIENRLTELKALFKEKTVEEDHYYQHPCRDFQRTDEALRIRISGNRYFVTYKGPKIDKDTKARAELEIKIDNPEPYNRLFEQLGFKEAGMVLKTRKTYTFRDCSIMLDSVNELGEFVEIECFGNFEECKKSIFDTAALLKINSFERRSYFELINNKK